MTYDSIDVHVLADKGSCQSVVFRRHVLQPVADRHPERPPPKLVFSLRLPLFSAAMLIPSLKFLAIQNLKAT